MSSEGGGRHKPRCLTWMPRARAECGRPLNHPGKHLTEAAVRTGNVRTNAYHRSNRVQRHAKIDAYKLRLGCIDCGYAESAVALDFDHRDPSLKIQGLAFMLTYSWEKIVAELDKCDVRCSNCHRIKTHRQLRTRGRNRQQAAAPSPA